ncbi:multiple RNA-binding domain-containing protein 1-like isoform X2 [Vicia villosa]|uniref:multiple RNA-binding domain-containing protein 1-like isoform X2 n=1 Tax=Vicia villosa TaxID=3911 RepID=UPI00273BCAEC|nr:multiple RNA-binding domain-containing protein 1-like isoform X2 [Vicia villosa]XP_058728755.1 multiple RNA-binding domain-containing protein 1-like isoform X2 [Vicia villosa]
MSICLPRTEKVANLPILAFGQTSKLRKPFNILINLTLTPEELPVSDANLPRPWSRHSTKEGNKVITPNAKDHARAKGQEDNAKDIDDPKLQDFLQVMQPRANSKLWGNDTTIVSNDANNQTTLNKETHGTSIANHPILSDAQAVDDKVMTDMDYFQSRVITEWSDSVSSDDENNIDNSHSESADDDDKDNRCHGSEREEEDCGNNPSERNPRSGAQELDTFGEDVANDKFQVSATEDKKEVSEAYRLFVRNLPYTTTDEELEEHFSQFGGFSHVHLVVDKETNRSKGRAYIHFTAPDSAARALQESDNSIFQGRLLHVMPAIQRPSSNEKKNVSKDQGTKTLKQRRQQERKASEASGDTRAWNSLFMRPDTIVENITRKYGVSKSDLLDREADDPALSIALGETQVISETKNAFKKAGVNVEALEELAKGKVDGITRSNNVILAKNLPYSATKNELAKMFGEFGSLDKIILPSTKTLALVVFLEAAEAKAAFRGLAYKRYKDAPLYLEWAPSNVLSDNEMNSGIGEKDVKRQMLEQDVERISDVEIDPDRARSVFVKNLSFKTTEEGLRKHFSEHMKEGKILSVKVKKHLRNGKNVSMGYGFVEFDSTETATSVCSDLQGTVLDGHAHILQLCRVKNDAKVEKRVEKNKSSTKLLVKNVAFEATKKDLRQLFSPFGQIKSLKLPMRFGKYRGFAFVEYVTQQEAQNALTALSSTHLYGRHLVIERAEEGKSLEELRAQTAAQFNQHSGYQYANNLSKKRKAIGMVDEENIKFGRFD